MDPSQQHQQELGKLLTEQATTSATKTLSDESTSTKKKNLKWVDDDHHTRDSKHNEERVDDEDDDDVEDDEEEEEECYDPKTGKRVITEHMSEETKRRIMEEEKRKMEELLSPHVEFRITPMPKRMTPAERRLKSQQALEQARYDVAVTVGSPCPVVRDPESGYILPRESVVTHSKPIEVEVGDDDDVLGHHREKILIAPPTTGWIGTEDEIEIQKQKMIEQQTRKHYAASYRVLEEMRYKKLMRELGDLEK